MTNKLIGFTISRSPINNDDIDIFDVGLNLKSFKKHRLYFYLWGKGDIDQCIAGDAYSMAFPLSDNLLDRNVLIRTNEDNITIENDWLGSIPVFYNPKKLIVSTLPLKTLKDKAIHAEGLNNYLEFGYSILERTAFADVRFLRYYSMLTITQDKLEVSCKKDPILEPGLFEQRRDEHEILDIIEAYIHSIESKTSGEIILPTSGGYDSRLLNLCVSDKLRIRSFTYGISTNQSRSFEVIHAKKASQILGTQWEQIRLGNFNQYIPQWFKLYGFATHLHGMYHIEFYKKILTSHTFSKHATFLSGIFGDVWAGNVEYEQIYHVSDLIKLGYAHGLNIDMRFFTANPQNDLKNKFFENNRDLLIDDKIKIIFTIRLKLMLISYLTQIPEYFGFPVWTPFLNFNHAVGMLTIAEERRKKRIWQKDYFVRHGLDLESMKIKSNRSNTLDYMASKNSIFEPIDVALMSRYVQKKHLEKINSALANRGMWEDIKNGMFMIPKIGRICRILGIKNDLINSLYEYYVIKAIEMGLKYAN